jgi:hypothetical protein
MAGNEHNTNQHSHVIAILQDKLTQLSTYFGRFSIAICRSADSDTFQSVFPRIHVITFTSHSISESAACSITQFPDHFRFSGDIHKVTRKNRFPFCGGAQPQ